MQNFDKVRHKVRFICIHCLDRTEDHNVLETDHTCVGSKHKLCRKVTTDCSLIIPIFVNGFDHNTKLQNIQYIFFLLHVAVYSNYNYVYILRAED